MGSHGEWFGRDVLGPAGLGPWDWTITTRSVRPALSPGPLP